MGVPATRGDFFWPMAVNAFQIPLDLPDWMWKASNVFGVDLIK
jgi:hypothetical protein